jgi:hypothetical protein
MKLQTFVKLIYSKEGNSYIGFIFYEVVIDGSWSKKNEEQISFKTKLFLMIFFYWFILYSHIFKSLWHKFNGEINTNTLKYDICIYIYLNVTSSPLKNHVQSPEQNYRYTHSTPLDETLYASHTSEYFSRIISSNSQ